MATYFEAINDDGKVQITDKNYNLTMQSSWGKGSAQYYPLSYYKIGSYTASALTTNQSRNESVVFSIYGFEIDDEATYFIKPPSDGQIVFVMNVSPLMTLNEASGATKYLTIAVMSNGIGRYASATRFEDITYIYKFMNKVSAGNKYRGMGIRTYDENGNLTFSSERPVLRVLDYINIENVTATSTDDIMDATKYKTVPHNFDTVTRTYDTPILISPIQSCYCWSEYWGTSTWNLFEYMQWPIWIVTQNSVTIDYVTYCNHLAFQNVRSSITSGGYDSEETAKTMWMQMAAAPCMSNRTEAIIAKGGY